MGWLPVALAITGTAVQTLSSANQASAQASAQQAAATAQDYEATTIKQQAAFDEAQSRRRADLLIGKQVATGAASGVDVSSGSSLFAELDSLKQAELDALNVRHQGEVGAWAKRYGAQMSRFQASRTRASIPGIYAGGVAQLGSTLATSKYGQGVLDRGGTLLSQWMR